jgi:hypothetical protein
MTRRIGQTHPRFDFRLILPGLLLALTACDSGAVVGRASFALEADASFFRLRIFATAPDASLSGKTLFDTGCIDQQSRTYELTNIPVGEGYSVVYEGYPSAGCASSQRLAVGFRGGVAITKDDQPYYHVQIYPTGGVATLPEDLNLSASNARPVDACAIDSDCGAKSLCYDDAAPAYWCVPTCVSTADCASLHPRATCDTAAGWCLLMSPFPLNLSEARAFGQAATLDNGDVAFFGGLKREGVASAGETASFIGTSFPLERFDAQTGLFAELTVTGLEDSPGGAFGFAALGNDRFVAVGGLARAQMGYGASGVLDIQATWSQDLLGQIIVWDLATGRGKLSPLGQGQARATVVPLSADRFLAIGGISPAGISADVRKTTLLCEIAADLTTSCQPGPQLDTARQAPAAACLDTACDRILVLGGNSGGKLAEVLDLALSKTTPLTTKGLPERLFNPILCGLDIVSGSLDLNKANPTIATRLKLDEAGLEGNPLVGAPATSYLSTVAQASPTTGSNSNCLIAGGLDAAGFNGRIVQVGSARFDVQSASLGRPRFAGQAAIIGAGPLMGRVLFAGGLALPGAPDAPTSGGLGVVRGAEVFTP